MELPKGSYQGQGIEMFAVKFAKKFGEGAENRLAETIGASMVGEETSETGEVPDANKLKDHMGKYDTKVLEPPSNIHQEQGAPKEELPKPDSYQNKLAKATGASMAGEETQQTTTRSTKGAKNMIGECNGASMAVDETSQTTTQSNKTGKVPETNKLKDHMGKYDTKVQEPPNDTRQEQGALDEELPMPGNHQNKIAKATSAGTAEEEPRKPPISLQRPPVPAWQGRKPRKPSPS